MFYILAILLLLYEYVAFAIGCPRGSFWDSSTLGCELCPPGSYQHTPNSTSCLPCAPGKYLTYGGAHSPEVCRYCPTGTVSSSGSSSCTPCPNGTFSSERSSRCVTCPRGTRIPHWIGVSDEDCETCFAGYADEENLLQCKRCPSGSGAPGGATSVDQCIQCGAGMDSDGYNPCSECQPGTFSDSPSMKCEVCPAGSVAEKSFGSTKCIQCEPGQYGRVVRGYGTHPLCFDCPDNTTSYSPGRRFCRRVDGPCPRGYIQTSSGDCERCHVDERYDLEEERCIRCAANEGSVGGLPLKCAPCADVMRANVARSHCFPSEYLQGTAIVSQTCAPGTHIFDADYARLCLPCQPGFFSSESDATECARCPNGTVATEEGATRCEPCPDGMIPDQYPTQCVDRMTNCPIDTELVVHDQGRTSCVSKDCSISEDGSYSCPPCTGSYFGSFSFEGCEPCPGNQVRDSDFVCGCKGRLAQNLGIVNGTCSQCPAGSYGKWMGHEVDNECTTCPAGTYRVVPTNESLCPGCWQRKPCQKCPAGFITRHDGATECEKCPAGTFSYGVGDTECLSFGAASRPASFNDPLDLEMHRELERFPEWWDIFLT